MAPVGRLRAERKQRGTMKKNEENNQKTHQTLELVMCVPAVYDYISGMTYSEKHRFETTIKFGFRN